ncbi:PaaX family transcriptional regulator [Peribacillus sp. NPDC096540]|uniref:PaaX family transcriptional regulator n=1 Tax=Peribacillus sp. NPDC096540 TaxID=3390612 RepID=UPI003D060082
MKPRSLLYTLFGDFVQFYGGEVWIGTLIKMMNHFGISESSVRGAILRLVQQDLIIGRKIGNKSYYSLTPKGKRNMDDGVKRVYTIRNHQWDGLWRVVTYSIPEEKRVLRNQVRKELSWTGFGLMSNSIWVSPNPLEKQVLTLMDTYDLKDYLIIFSSSQVITHTNEEILSTCWDLKEINKNYLTFIQQYESKLHDMQQAVWEDTISNEQCFYERTKIVHEYRKFLFLDPGFPLDLLPGDWHGIKARELFWNIHQLISVKAVKYFESIMEYPPDKAGNVNREKAINPFSEIYHD